MMIFVNTVFENKKITKSSLEKFLIILSPFTPHVSEEVWNLIGNKKSIYQEAWPKFDEKLLKDEKVRIAVQINGKTRGEILVDADISDEEVKNEALKNEKIAEIISGKELKRVIVVKNRLINMVIA